jgi:hypothetical protein
VAALPERLHDLRLQDADAAGQVDARIARLAALFRNLPVEGAVRDALVRFRDAGYLTRQTADGVALVLKLDDLPQEELDLRRFLHRAGRLWATAFCALGARMAAGEEGLDRWRAVLPRLVDLVRREGELLFDPPRLVSGADVQALLGIPPGKEIGRVLDAVRAAQVEGRVRTREEAVALVTKSQLRHEDRA